MDLELLQILAQGGFSVVIVWLLMDMRRESKEQREYIQRLLEWMIQQNFPDMAVSQITRLPNRSPGSAPMAKDNRSDADI